MLVDMEPGRTLLDLIALEQNLSDILGRQVDVVTDGGISPLVPTCVIASWPRL